MDFAYLRRTMLISRILRVFRLLPLLVALTAPACLTGGATQNALNGSGAPGSILEKSEPAPVAAANGPSSSDVMVATSDSSNAQGDQCSALKKVQKEYAGTGLRIPDCYNSRIGWQSPNSQDPVDQPKPNVFYDFDAGSWMYPLTLTVQALFKKAEQIPDTPLQYTHEDFQRGPAVLLILGQQLATGNPGDISWDTAALCEVPLMAVTRDEGLDFANVRQNIAVNEDILLNVYLHFKPPAGATSATDYDPTTSLGTPAVPSSSPCKYWIKFSSEDEINTLLNDIHVFGLGSFAIDVPDMLMATPVPDPEGIPADDAPIQKKEDSIKESLIGPNRDLMRRVR